MRAGLALIETVAKLDAGHTTSLQVRIGIATGLVVVDDLHGEGAALWDKAARCSRTSVLLA
ncbi:hypothetical protein [Bradyrhizobium sp. Leo170]|uniref:hypothetical protein n=1 Tax=Bradyrhizobium sp. Leo170 TaxID=1571199 RepID=UPI00102E8761|nr:hypothetical protein [Bradyrhizobium sp. Leo170]TAI61166.1 hypothetical protein CWO89_36650 [Bradyrhizobium sp. Leo170]